MVESNQPCSSSQHGSQFVTPGATRGTSAFPGSSDIVVLSERYVTIFSSAFVEQLPLPSYCTGYELSGGRGRGGGVSPFLLITCTDKATVLELYEKDDQYAIDDVFRHSEGTTVALVSSGFVFSRGALGGALGGATLHYKDITSSADPTLVDIIELFDINCGTPYPRTFTDTHFILKCTNGYYLCSVSGCLREFLNVPAGALLVTSPDGKVAALSSSALTIYDNNFKTTCHLTIPESATLEFHQDILLNKSLNALYYVNVSEGCPSSPTLLDTFVGVPECFGGNCTDYFLNDEILVITTRVNDDLVALNFYRTSTMEKLDRIVQYHSPPLAYGVISVPMPRVTVTTTIVTGTTTVTSVTTIIPASTTITSQSMTPAPISSPPTVPVPTVSPMASTIISKLEIYIPVITISLIILSIISIVVIVTVRCCKGKKNGIMKTPVQEEQEQSIPMSGPSLSEASSLSMDVAEPIQCTSP